MDTTFTDETAMRLDLLLVTPAESAKRGREVKKLIDFIIFSTVSCVVASVSALWEHVRRFVRDGFSAKQTIKKRYGNI